MFLQGQGSLIEVKIADFGLSALVRIGEDGYDVEESSKRKKYKGLTEMWGTKEYFAPELIDQAYGPQADLWALGCILFEMLCGHQGALSKSHSLPSFVSAFLSVSAFVYLTGSFSASIYLVDRICSQHPNPLFLCSRPSPLPKRFLSARGTTKTPSTEEYRRENTTSRGKPSHFPSLMLTAFLPVRLALHVSSSLSLT